MEKKYVKLNDNFSSLTGSDFSEKLNSINKYCDKVWYEHHNKYEYKNKYETRPANYLTTIDTFILDDDDNYIYIPWHYYGLTTYNIKNKNEQLVGESNEDVSEKQIIHIQ